uniref:Ribosomal protein S2 n=1 Tax=Babesia duncani TaxID=323732 RepID=A0A385GNJ8_9APIC|nr:ribosomal protein S2 [Babesia duncani]
MIRLTFNYFLNKNLHLNNINSVNNYKLYKIINKNCYIFNLIYIIICLYKLYKIFYTLSRRKVNITFINILKFINTSFIKYLLLFSRNNYFSGSWIKGFLTNNNILKSIFIYCLWSEKIKKFVVNYIDNKLYKYIYRVYKKFKYISKNLKYLGFSKFIFFFNLNNNKEAVKECIIKNKFIAGLCNLNYYNNLIDFYMYYNCMNEVSINTVIEFIIISIINSNK